jgi:deoxyhypusine synthase
VAQPRATPRSLAALIQTAYEEGVPIFCPAFVDSSAGFGLVKHQKEKIAAKQPYLMIDAVADFRELTDIKIAAGTTGLFMVGGGVPKNFAQDTVVCAEILGVEADMHKYAIQITVADVRDGACSSSTLKEACSAGARWTPPTSRWCSPKPPQWCR